MLEDIEDVLLRADLGTEVAARIAAAVGVGRYDKAISADDVKSRGRDRGREGAGAGGEAAGDRRRRKKPFVILVVGVNGSGKTTTIGKLAAKLSRRRPQGDAGGRRHLPRRRDRAAEDLGRAHRIARHRGRAGLGFREPCLQRADGGEASRSVDVLLIDTAGRLQNKAELMNELEKVVRVIRKVDASAPHAVLLVLDATVGQNALSQVEAFHRTAGVTGLVMTKLDGTARGGILVALAEKYKLPVHFIGVGEGVDDLAPFTARISPRRSRD